jgi:hypothetical protein
VADFLRHPITVFVLSLVILWLSVHFGSYLTTKLEPVTEEERKDLDLIIGASLTLLALIIGFSFSMAVSRYDQRKLYEENEANAIGSEYSRMNLLPAADAAKGRQLLGEYLNQRMLFYTATDSRQLDAVRAETAKLEGEMLSTVQGVAAAQQTATIALVVNGMDEVMNRERSTQAEWWNRIPEGAWLLMFGLAIICCVLTGHGARRKGLLPFMVLPLLVALAFFLIADIDTPRHGVIRVAPENLISLAQSLQAR